MFRRSALGQFLLVGAAVAMVATACGSTSSSPASQVDIGSGALTGAGSTFDNPLFSKAFYDYSAQHPQVTVNYGSVGSGAGIKQFIANTVDFGATDVPMASADITSAGGASSLTQIPVTLGVVSICFTVSGVTSLNLDGATLANIFLGHIKNWNDPAIAALNSGVNFPNEPIAVEHRSDGSGTTYIFTDYLSKISPDWKSTTGGPSKSIKWPVGTGSSGNAAVAQSIISTEGSIGYVELSYAAINGMHQAAIQNANGKFVTPSVAGATSAAQQNTSISATNFSITNEPGDATYPIAGFSWVILRTSYSDKEKGRAIVYLFQWLVTGGQSEGSTLEYAPLPSSVQQLALTNLKLISAGGSVVLS